MYSASFSDISQNLSSADQSFWVIMMNILVFIMERDLGSSYAGSL